MIDQAQRLREIMRSAGSGGGNSAGKPRMEAESVRGKLRTISVSSGKGGVGKTNIALMLSVALSLLKKKVLLFDGDLGLANVHILLGLAPQKNLSHVVSQECSIDEIICEGPGGVRIIPGASGMEKLANADPLQLEILKRSLIPLQQQYDLMVIDTSAGIGTAASGFASLADRSLCVMTPEPTSLADAYAMVKVLHERGAESIEVLVNMANSDTEGMEAFDRLNTLSSRFLKRKLNCAGILPSDRDIPRMVRRQKLITVEKPNSTFSVRLAGCARKICGIPAVSNQGFFSRVFAKIGG